MGSGFGEASVFENFGFRTWDPGGYWAYNSILPSLQYDINRAGLPSTTTPGNHQPPAVGSFEGTLHGSFPK